MTTTTEAAARLVLLLDEVCAAAVDFSQYEERDEMCSGAYDAALARLVTARRAVETARAYEGCALSDPDIALEHAYWEFDAMRAGRNRGPYLTGSPMAERDAFKAAVRKFPVIHEEAKD
jgi:hypothetical protein